MFRAIQRDNGSHVAIKVIGRETKAFAQQRRGERVNQQEQTQEEKREQEHQLQGVPHQVVRQRICCLQLPAVVARRVLCQLFFSIAIILLCLPVGRLGVLWCAETMCVCRSYGNKDCHHAHTEASPQHAAAAWRV